MVVVMSCGTLGQRMKTGNENTEKSSDLYQSTELICKSHAKLWVLYWASFILTKSEGRTFLMSLKKVLMLFMFGDGNDGKELKFAFQFCIHFHLV